MVPAFPQWNSPLVYIPEPNAKDSGLNAGQMTPQWLAFFQWVWSLRTTVQLNMSAVGTNADTATPLDADWCEVTGVDNLNTAGVVMSGLGPGDSVVVVNATGGSSIFVYPLPNALIDGSPSYTLADGKMQIFRVFSNKVIYSEQLG